jgi:hypothetical protein
MEAIEKLLQELYSVHEINGAVVIIPIWLL